MKKYCGKNSEKNDIVLCLCKYLNRIQLDYHAFNCHPFSLLWHHMTCELWKTPVYTFQRKWKRPHNTLKTVRDSHRSQDQYENLWAGERLRRWRKNWHRKTQQQHLQADRVQGELQREKSPVMRTSHLVIGENHDASCRAEKPKGEGGLEGKWVISGFRDLNVKWQRDMQVPTELGHRRW